MGGHAFHDTRPLSTPEHDALLSHVQRTFEHRFDGVGHARQLRSKRRFLPARITLVHSSWLDIVLFHHAYAHTFSILSSLLATLSPTLRLTPNRLIMFHRPYPVPQARRCDVTLMASPVELCAFLGPDYAAWQAADWEDEDEIWVLGARQAG
ncbi:hypothetical protein Q5752_006035 [Cryptotrichosporon argae]